MNDFPNTSNELYSIAESQAGYFSITQAESVGIARQQIYQGVTTGKYWKADHGVYRFIEFPADRFEDLHRALLQAGEKAVVGFISALYVYDLSDLIPYQIHLILPRTSSRRRPEGIRMHTNKLQPEDITVWEGLRITTVARTICDCAFSNVEEHHIRMAIRQALQRGLTTKEKLLVQSKQRSKRIQTLIRKSIQGAKH